MSHDVALLWHSATYVTRMAYSAKHSKLSTVTNWEFVQNFVKRTCHDIAVSNWLLTE
jgi:hypothetical protein